MDDKRFTGAVSVGSEQGRSIVLATQGEEIVIAVPMPGGTQQYVLSETEAWCLARQLDVACRRLRREAKRGEVAELSR